MRYTAGMKRREFIAGLGGAAVAPMVLWPAAVRAQPSGKKVHLGVFGAPTNPITGPAFRAFHDELRKAGFVEGRNLFADWRPTDQDLAALSAQAAEMARANVDALVALGAEQTLQACVRASRSIPIVFVANNYDPIARGYVQSLAKPGGNITGVFLRQTELSEKQVELLTQAFPDRTRLAVLWDYVSADQFEAAERQARRLGLEVISCRLENPPYDIDAAFRGMSEAGANMLLVLSSPFFGRHRDRIVELAIRQRLPSMFIFKGYADAGGLMSYGADPVAMYRQGAVFVDKILKGAKPADLPVELPTKFEMVLNLKTAKAIGVELPTTVLIRADEVIE